MHPMVKKYPKVFTFLTGALIYVAIRKGLIILFGLPTGASFDDPRYFIAMFKGQNYDMSYVFGAIGIICTIVGYQLTNPIIRRGLYISAGLCLLNFYNIFSKGPNGPLSQFLVTIVLLGIILYFVMGISFKKK
jgi:hypothetical protein